MSEKHQFETTHERVQRVARRLRKPVEVVDAKLRELEAEQAAERSRSGTRTITVQVTENSFVAPRYEP